MAKLGKIATKRRGRSPKIKVIEELEAFFRQGDGFVFLNNNGLTVAEVTQLRSKLRESNVALKVAKNTLISIALKNTGYELNGGAAKLLNGPTMVAIGLSDVIAPAKLLVEFVKEHGGHIEIKGGILEHDVLSAKDVDELSRLPGRPELIAKMLGSLQAPVQNLTYALNASVAQVVWALDAYVKKHEGSEAA